jgi:branched-subunit amino acid transport protein AzlD
MLWSVSSGAYLSEEHVCGRDFVNMVTTARPVAMLVMLVVYCGTLRRVELLLSF